MMSNYGYEVGPQYGTTGSHNASGRVSVAGAHVITDGHGHFFESVRTGMTGTGQGVWSATIGVGGVAPGTALSTTPAFAVWNPSNSGVVLSILKTRLGYVSGTLGAGTIAYAYVASQAAKPTTGTALSPNPQLVGAQSTPRALAFSGSTVSATPTLLAPGFIINAMLATTATNPVVVEDQVDGEIIVLPGGVFCMHGIAAAGTSPLVILSASWEEIPALP